MQQVLLGQKAAAWPVMNAKCLSSCETPTEKQRPMERERERKRESKSKSNNNDNNRSGKKGSGRFSVSLECQATHKQLPSGQNTTSLPAMRLWLPELSEVRLLCTLFLSPTPFLSLSLFLCE